ncbi:hypothetical protein [Nostoc sp.]|uniref:hypothetical protein n=1 Tax=Nostoc sp. TaxID=1180 RepID=UPI002FF444B6
MKKNLAILNSGVRINTSAPFDFALWLRSVTKRFSQNGHFCSLIGLGSDRS